MITELVQDCMTREELAAMTDEELIKWVRDTLAWFDTPAGREFSSRFPKAKTTIKQSYEEWVTVMTTWAFERRELARK